jgi:hypothetical protein
LIPLLGLAKVTKTLKRIQKNTKKAPKRRFFDLTCRHGDRLCASSHEHGDERQQENQNSTAQGKHDGHQGNNGFHNVLLAVMVGGLVVGHGDFLNRWMF